MLFCNLDNEPTPEFVKLGIGHLLMGLFKYGFLHQ